MNRSVKPARPKVSTILSTIVFILLGLILIGTAGSLLLKGEKTEVRRRDTTPTTQGYLSLGQIRSATQEGDVLVVVSPWFSYPPDDSAFYEELSKKQLTLQRITRDFFSHRTKQDILGQSEERVKQELCRMMNEELVLGKIGRAHV
jgi:flagellar basal body-associated protein FliL